MNQILKWLFDWSLSFTAADQLCCDRVMVLRGTHTHIDTNSINGRQSINDDLMSSNSWTLNIQPINHLRVLRPLPPTIQSAPFCIWHLTGLNSLSCVLSRLKPAFKLWGQMKRTPGPEAWRAGALGLDTQSEQEGGELDVRDEAKTDEVTWWQVICPGETLRGWDGYKLHKNTFLNISEYPVLAVFILSIKPRYWWPFLTKLKTK